MCPLPVDKVDIHTTVVSMSIAGQSDYPRTPQDTPGYTRTLQDTNIFVSLH